MCITIYVHPHFKNNVTCCHMRRKNSISQYVSDVKKINNPMIGTSDRSSTSNVLGGVFNALCNDSIRIIHFNMLHIP